MSGSCETRSPTCESCGKPFVEHLGVVGTCAALQKASAEVAQARALCEEYGATMGRAEKLIGELTARNAELCRKLEEHTSGIPACEPDKAYARVVPGAFDGAFSVGFAHRPKCACGAPCDTQRDQCGKCRQASAMEAAR